MNLRLLNKYFLYTHQEELAWRHDRLTAIRQRSKMLIYDYSTTAPFEANNKYSTEYTKSCCHVTDWLTHPETNEDGEEDGGAVVEQVAGLDLATHARVVPVRTALVTLRTHREVVVFVTTLVPIATTSHDTWATLVSDNQSRNTNTWSSYKLATSHSTVG